MAMGGAPGQWLGGAWRWCAPGQPVSRWLGAAGVVAVGERGGGWMVSGRGGTPGAVGVGVSENGAVV
ncbi:hypothetical protein GCM10018962_63230 [Dactylosporangium matsuzakiense]|uniref:Uncharacterized protein n=1 Tax=Dactylosporangium matsuzakiense TaxID=53360 RepID=A0A9W6KF42_9ACTN|nr:hypothetical protein GCM10017581_026580 [Dactylosporangium matsuzakiense]